MQEMSGVITTQKAWALPDAIGLAYVPYSRVKFNTEGYTDNFAGGADNAFDILMDGDGQFAAISSAGYGVVEGNYGYRAYYFSLIVAYGVHYQFLRDTSYGATHYIHRPYDSKDDDQTPTFGHCQVTGKYYDYAFFKNQRFTNYNLRDRTFTSAELAAQQGWPDWAKNKPWTGGSFWKTSYPPIGCEYEK